MIFFRVLIYLFLIFQNVYAESSIIKRDLNNTNVLLLQSGYYYMSEHNLSMARKSAHKAIDILFENNKLYDARTITAYNMIAATYLAEGDIEYAKQTIEKAIYIQAKIKHIHNSLITTYFMMAEIKKIEKKYTEAIRYYKKTLQIMKELDNTKNNMDIHEKSLKEIKALSNLAEDEIVYNEFSFLDFVHNIKSNTPAVTIDEYINNKNTKNSECLQGLCQKISREYFKIDDIYEVYLKNPSKKKDNLFDFYKITNFNYILNTLGVCALLNNDKNETRQNNILKKLNNDLLSIMKNSKNPLELDIIILNYKSFYSVLKKLDVFEKFFKHNHFFSKTDFFQKLQEYKEIQLKEQNPKLVTTIPKNKQNILYARYKYFKEYLNKYFINMETIIRDNNYIEWKNNLNNLNKIIKNKDLIIKRNGEKGKAEVWAVSVILYFESSFDNYIKIYTK